MSKEAINAVDEYGYTALHYVASNGNEKICKLLLSNMSKEAINSIDDAGHTALHFAAINPPIKYLT
ncbi:ankyrin repeat domain-containing protein [Rickettsia endosymbiont of Rhinocyllus conicus]|uniref:ankyrin repeat domain-containing protein n=1 Tax=Rickettsia endosymbiont of Rhinocyllus conicus TaxID=3066252 RepID=UPI0031329F0D